MRTPSSAGYWIAGALAVLGLAAAIAWFATVALRAIAEPEGLARTSVPGSVTLPVAERGNQVIYYEGNAARSWQQLGLSVTDPDGKAVQLETYEKDLRYDVPGNTDLVATAIARFRVDTPGAYQVTTTTGARATAKLAVGDDIGRDIPGAALLAGVVILGTALATSAIAFATYRRRSTLAERRP